MPDAPSFGVFKHLGVFFFFLIVLFSLKINIFQFFPQSIRITIFTFMQFVKEEVDQCIYLSDNLKQLPVFPVYQFNSV